MILASQFKGVQIRARWDGVQEHPAAVSIRFTIDAQPCTHLQLLKADDPLVVSYTIRCVVSNANKTIEKPLFGHTTKDIDWNTLTASRAEDCLPNIEQGRIENDAQRPKPLRCLSSSAVNRSASQGTPTRYPAANDILTSNGGLPERRVCSSAPESEYRPSQMKLSSTLEIWSARSPRRFKIRARRGQQGREHTEDDAAALDTPTHKPRKPATLPRSSRPLKITAISGCIVRRPIDEPSRYYGTRPLVRARNVESQIDNPEPCGRVVTVVGPIKTNTLGTTYQDTLMTPPRILTRRELLSPIAAPFSPAESPRIWLYGTSMMQCMYSVLPYSLDLYQLEVAADTLPTTIVSNETLYACFPALMCPDTYEVKVDVNVLLSEPDILGWRSFIIPGLLEQSGGSRGLIQFSLVSQEKDHGEVPAAQFDPTGCVVIQDAHQGQLKGDFALNEPFCLRLRFEGEVNHVKEWNSNVNVYSAAYRKQGLGVYTRNQVSLTIEPIKKDPSARRTMFSVIIRNGPPDGGVYRLGAGECVVELSSHVHTVREFEREVTIWIERDTEDMEKQLKLIFSCHYPSIQGASIVLPVILPKIGKILSEKVWILKPLPPLALCPITRSFLSTWECTELSAGGREVLCYHRKEMPSTYPHAMSDDVVVRLHNLEPVSFVGLEVPDDLGGVEQCSGMVRALNMTGKKHPHILYSQSAWQAWQSMPQLSRQSDGVPGHGLRLDIVPGNRLECCLSLDLEVGTNPLLSIEALGWVPTYASINGQICSQDHPLWWKEGDGLCLIRAPWMSQGDILHIEISFTLIRRIDDLSTEKERFVMVNGTLPHITDKVILGGNLTCNISDAVVKVYSNRDNHLVDSERVTFSARAGENTRRLSLLRRGYRLEFGVHLLNPKWRFRSKPLVKADKIRFSKGVPLQPRSLRFEDESEDTSSSSSKYSYEGPNVMSSPGMQSSMQESVQDEKTSDTDDEDNLESRTSDATTDHVGDHESLSSSHHSGSESQVDLPSMEEERWSDAMIAALNTNDNDIGIEKGDNEDHEDDDPAGIDFQGDISNSSEEKEENDEDDPHPVEDDMATDADGNIAGVLARFQPILNDDTDPEDEDDDDDEDDDENWDDDEFDDLFSHWNNFVRGVSIMILWFLLGV
ncbi:MAG: hypothetical protein Q9223_004721, partial [Gallowayella weberi]